jgi:hypothetical protein
MAHIANGRSVSRHALAGALALGVMAAPTVARADEGGVSLWVPGFLSSFAASPLVPGFSYTTIGYNTHVTAGGDVAFARQVTRGNLAVNFTGNLNANLKADVGLGMAIPSYTFAEKIFGAQATVLALVPYGRANVSVDAALTGNLGLGGPGFTIGGAAADAISGFADLATLFNLRWNAGVDNYMVYFLNNIPVGRYDPTRLANLGIGHFGADMGGAYTYLNPATGREFSATLGFSFNAENPSTQYYNGVDAHLDWGASQFLTKQFNVGLVGYAYQQLSCDGGAGDRVGCFKSRVFGVGPQMNYIMPLSAMYQAVFSLKGFKEFGAEHRPEGWNVWLTLSISPAAPPAPAPVVKAMMGK